MVADIKVEMLGVHAPSARARAGSSAEGSYLKALGELRQKQLLLLCTLAPGTVSKTVITAELQFWSEGCE